ncbi:hypothetical protein COHA_009280 [Chlorella ohadii]|uniref:Uncharacterized protein n=1 Tax=Chlorella ohadii TaxID=2649997 RepID=A0AAD5DJV1_9CHLO|nr:hypothetical protein COHA_009280 [Chlorella ohadii]
MLSSDVQAAMISGTALVVAGWGGAYVLGNTLANGIEQAAERASKTLAESLKAGSEGLAALGDAAQAYKPAVAALGRSLERGLLLSLFPSSRSAPQCKDCGKRLTDAGVNGNTRSPPCEQCGKRHAAKGANMGS